MGVGVKMGTDEDCSGVRVKMRLGMGVRVWLRVGIGMGVRVGMG